MHFVDYYVNKLTICFSCIFYISLFLYFVLQIDPLTPVINLQ